MAVTVRSSKSITPRSSLSRRYSSSTARNNSQTGRKARAFRQAIHRVRWPRSASRTAFASAARWPGSQGGAFLMSSRKDRSRVSRWRASRAPVARRAGREAGPGSRISSSAIRTGSGGAGSDSRIRRQPASAPRISSRSDGGGEASRTSGSSARSSNRRRQVRRLARYFPAACRSPPRVRPTSRGSAARRSPSKPAAPENTRSTASARTTGIARSSRTSTPGLTPASSGNSRTSPRLNASIVETCTSARSLRPASRRRLSGSASRATIRSFISAAALRVKVRARMFRGETPHSSRFR